MEAKRRFIPYDIFKLIVAILLLLAIIALWLTLPKGEVAAPEPIPAETAEVAVVESEVVPEPTEAPPPTPHPEPTQEEPPAPAVELPPLPQPSNGLSYDAENARVVTDDGTPRYQLNDDGTDWVPIIPDAMVAMQLSSTGEYQWALTGEEDAPTYYWDFDTHAWAAVEQPIDEPVEEATPVVAVAECPDALPSRITPGGQVQVLSNLNFRASPDIYEDNWLATLLPGTQLATLGETACTEYDFGSYLWWKVEREDGSVGWSAEGTATGTNYFLEPVETP